MRSVLFPGLDSLVGLARHGVDVKPTLLRVLTDLYVQKPAHSHDEECQYIELALRLIDTVDADTRAAVAHRLAAYPKAPGVILKRLRDSAPPRDGAPRDTASPPPARHTAPAPGETPALSPQSEAAMTEAATLTERFFAADSHGRLHLLAALNTQVPPEFTPGAVPPAVCQKLEASALAGRPSEFIRALEHALGVTRTLTETIVNDSSGEPLLVAAKALSIPIDVLQRILLFVNPAIGHSVQRIYALTALYDQISLASALRLVAAWRQIAPAAARTRSPTPSPAPEARPSRGSATQAPFRSAASAPSRSSENLVTRNREFGMPRPAPRPSSAHDPIKKMTP